MSYASGTTHYNLPQTVGSDKRDWTDTNQAFSDIDAAIYGAAQGASAATSAIETINGQIETITGKQSVDEGNISTLAGKVSTLESTVGTQAAAIADVRQDLQDNIESKKEASATSTRAYNVGDTFYYNDVLYKATSPIAIGGTIVPSTNCTAVTVMSEIAAVKTDESFTVTADGVKTTAQILSDIYAMLDFTKLKIGRSIINVHFQGWEEGRVQGFIYNGRGKTTTDDFVSFSNVMSTSATDIGVSAYVLRPTGSYNLVGNIAGGTVTDYGSSVASAGSTYTVIY